MSKPSQKDVSQGLSGFASRKLEQIEAKNQRRRLFDHTRRDHMQAVRETVGEVISFTDNDYLGLSVHPEVVSATEAATRRFGAGSGASRLVTGNHPLYSQLEAAIADLKGAEDAVVFGSGYLANVGIIPTLVGKDDLIIADELVHTCLHAGMKLSGATVKFFRHNDVGHASELLKTYRSQHPHALIVVDGVYSMDGDIAPLGALSDLGRDHDAWLMSDDAHGVGVTGGGRGSTAACGVEGLVPLQMGTLSKAVGSYGGYLAADRTVCDLIRNRARSLIYTTALPPGVIAASLKAIEIIKRDPAMCARPCQLAVKFAVALGLETPQTPIVPLIVGEEGAAMKASDKLAREGFLVWAFRPPTVPVGSSRLRFCFSATHRDEDVDALIDACRRLGLGPERERG